MIERRFIASRVELHRHESNEGEERSLTGYCAKWNVLSSDLGGFRERLRPSAFRNVLREKQDVKFLVDHNPSKLLGRVKNGTLQLSEDNIGFRFTVILPPTTVARDTYALVQNRTLTDCSFAFEVGDDDYAEECDEQDRSHRYLVRSIRTIKNCYDASIVTNPAYPSTEVGIGPLHLASAPLAATWAAARMAAQFPDGVPQEIRSRVMAAQRNNFSRSKQARRNLLSLVIS